MLAPWKEGYDKPRQHINKQRHQFADKGSYNQSYVFSSHHVWMWEWTIKKAEHQIIDASELWHLRVPWTARRSNQSILKKINPEYSLEGLMLKLQSFGHLMGRTDSLEKTLMLGKIEGGRRRGWQRMRWWVASSIQWTWTWANSGRWWGTGKLSVLQSMGSQRVGHDLVTEQQQQEAKILQAMWRKKKCRK